jgi:hypothetical protein
LVPSGLSASKTSNPSMPSARIISTRAPRIAPTNWAPMKVPASRHETRPPMAAPIETAGLKWPPEMRPRA